jgi:hypothetical protein
MDGENTGKNTDISGEVHIDRFIYVSFARNIYRQGAAIRRHDPQDPTRIGEKKLSNPGGAWAESRAWQG